ncbi:kynurenine 3-monooxygenase-like [Schistocerca serialis cubense]|uniref:kynurenine 3-monooxygenase-like n=1 Tax=Schistocerca serialis cubense TaxID=2023355 RepID=UPI00214E311B|nr:kynurenine 3-monooxygenase-like [Schistocerca serialis cubense]
MPAFPARLAPQPRSVAIVGGGLVGSLSACFFAKRGFQVDLYEYREDIRRTEHVRGRTINLTLSARGQAALRRLGLERALVAEHGVALRGRMVHHAAGAGAGALTAVPYDPVDNQCIYSISRRYLNEVLLTATEKYPNVRLHFRHKLVAINFKENQMTFQVGEENSQVQRSASLVVGADGAFSAVRRQMMKAPLFQYSQRYIEHGYLELCIPPTADGKFAMAEQYLHVWPRGSFMMIALPNQDCSWTVTLFMSFEQFEALDTTKALLDFFGQHFPDALPLIGTERLIKDYFSTKPSPLISIKCNPYHVGSSVIIVGDAAHAMVPFYGQGMNAGFEDCLILDNLMQQYNENFSKVLPKYSEIRNKDAEAICDLAMYNYYEMRDLMNHKSFLLRKKLDNALYQIIPKLWIPLYISVTFTSEGYSWCLKNKYWQDKAIRAVLGVFGMIMLLVVVLFIFFFIHAIIETPCKLFIVPEL